MNVHELIEVLKTYPQDAEVVAEWDHGWSNLDKHKLVKSEEGDDVVEFDVSEWGSTEA